MKFSKKHIFSLIVALCLFAQMIYAQSIDRLTGTVKDESGEVLIGASIIIKNTTHGSISDANGNYILTNIPTNGTLLASYLGYESVEISVNGRTQIDIVLSNTSQVLDEFVVVGYGVIRKSDLTGSVSSVKAADAIKNTPVADITSAIQGRLSGVSIVSTSGAPGSASTIRVRGMSSLAGDLGPLVVIDGIPSGSLSSLNPADIANIEVLKDASATAIYGSKGANGVIMVTTKNPQAGKISADYNAYVNFQSPIRLPKMMSPVQFANLANAYGREFYTSSSQPVRVFYTEDEIEAFGRGEGVYDYMNTVFRDVTLEHTHELSISGKSGKTGFLFSGSFNNDNGIAYNSNAKRVNYRLKVDSELRPWFKVGMNFWGDYTESYSPRFAQYQGLLIQGLTFPNTILPFVDNDRNNGYNNANLIAPQYNPQLFIDDVYKDNGYSNNSRLQGYFEVDLLKGLTFRMTQGFVFNNRVTRANNREFSYEYYQTNQNKTSAFAENSDAINWININTLSYIKEFNQNHRINATVAFEQESSKGFINRSSGLDLLAQEVGPYNTNAAVTVSGTSSGTESAMMSFLGRINYVLMNRYMLTASLRYDGSSRLYYPDNTWDYFPSMAIAWNIKEENFMKHLNWMNEFKLRLGYGETGSQNIDLYQVFDKTQSIKIANGDAGYVLAYGNKNIWWERTSQYNVGVDFGFFNNRITLNFDLYDKISKNIFAEMNVPLITGQSTTKGNSATIQNKGFEVTLGARPVVGRDFVWETNLTLSHNKGIVKDLPDGREWMEISGSHENTFYRLIKGEKIGSVWGYVNEGVWTTDEVNAGLAPAGIEAGAYKYAEFDGVEGTGPNDKQIISNGQPLFQWGWNNSLSYQNLDFSLFLIGFHGFDIYNYTREARFGPDNNLSLGPNPEWENRWIEGVNENASIAGFIRYRNGLTPSSQYIEKGDFMKVKSITLGYTLPHHWLSKATISKLRVYASIQNPFLITAYSGIDPEVTLRRSIVSGIDWGYYPNGRNMLIGLNLTF